MLYLQNLQNLQRFQIKKKRKRISVKCWDALKLGNIPFFCYTFVKVFLWYADSKPKAY